MSTINTSLMNILQAELINKGHNEFYDIKKTQLHFFKDDSVFIKKILNYDEDIEKIVNLKFFLNLTLDDPLADRKFKQQWINKFFNNRPAFQTIESFASEVVHIFLLNIDFLNEYYENINNYIRGKEDLGSIGNENTLTDNRTANATLPQSEINIDVDNTVLDYADENRIMRNKDRIEREEQNENYSYNLDNLIKARNILNVVFEDFERNCFLKVW